ncbi:MAG: secondary thiamine-phosphate synthase enzyme YjbQ [Candidatus Firestonebacteria bacterium]|nr:secondary thiamine-phosphate synthase enzyme YjbQ [Candidatus Firestonebacteria bacterium]
MQVITERVKLDTKGNSDIKEITGAVAKTIKSCGLENGTVTMFVPGATGAFTTIEFEPGLEADLKSFIEKIIPEKSKYQHNITHSDSNGHSHIRASLIGPSLVVPFSGKKLLLGKWQQIIFIDFDNRPREREIILQIMGV